MPPLEELEDGLGYQFRNRELLLRALTHRSWLPEQPSSSEADNEQLEFLGDSILGFLVSEALVVRHPFVREGELSQWKAHLVSSTYLHGCAVAVNLGEGAAQGHVRLNDELASAVTAFVFDDRLNDRRYPLTRSALESAGGLYVRLEKGGSHIFEVVTDRDQPRKHKRTKQTNL